ncbi:MAG: DUF447 family protein [Methanosarcinales archaeon]|nr:DUF447 family protein [Methanosarcinales archaeon]
MKIDLDQYGILEGINETIITTISLNGRFNAAPIGIIRRDGKLMVRIYNGSHTCSNIQDTGLFAANMVDDPVLFVQSALSDLDDKMFETIKIDKYGVFPILNKSSAWIIFKADYEKGTTAIQAELYPVTGEIRRSGITTINRGFNAVIEATIYATRYIAFKDEKYLRKVKTFKNIIDKCGGNQEKEAYELIIKLL